MEHALIIGGNRNSVDALEEHLWDAGYRSIAAARNIAEAWTIVRSLHPKIIIVVPDAISETPTNDLYEMSEMTGAPIIVATADPAAALRCLGPAVSLEGPYPVHAAPEPAAIASRPALYLAHAA